MLDFFRLLIKKQKPSYIISFTVASWGELNAVTCKWCRDGRYFVAQSFYTMGWISSSPLGPLTGGNTIADDGCITIRDVANVTEYAGRNECEHAPTVTEAKLEQTLKFIREHLSQTCANWIKDNQYGDTLQCTLCLSPCPTIAIAIYSAQSRGNFLVGTLMITNDGHVATCCVVHKRIYLYQELFKRAGNFWNADVKLLNGGSGKQ